MLRENVKEATRLHTGIESKKQALQLAEGLPLDTLRLMFPAYKGGTEFRLLDERVIFEVKRALTDHYSFGVAKLEKQLEELL